MAEEELSRRSVFAIYCMDSGPAGRSKKKPTSGAVQSIYTFSRHPLGGYGEVVLKAGGVVQGLPYIEIDVSGETPRGNARGVTPAEVDYIVDTFIAFLKRKPDANGLLCEIPVRTDLGGIEQDPDFWPRIVLGLDRRLFIRARNPEEAIKFIDWFTRYVQAGPDRTHEGWTSGEVASGSTYTGAVSYDAYKIYRVLAKIACGLAVLVFQQRAAKAFQETKEYILGKLPEKWDQLVKDVRNPGSVDLWPEHHVAAVAWVDSRLRGIVSIFGSYQLIDLGAPIELIGAQPVVATSKRNGTESKLLESVEAKEEMTKLLGALSDTSNLG